ncbi:E2/UBC family protein [Halorientalis salina]|uniref:E2/UBC family protein n=1 Tax=Halorientalis salina TaxID=2932266 RepID=UPI00145F7930|nr:E2/UBC family protein [Halorientalis salina]
MSRTDQVQPDYNHLEKLVQVTQDALVEAETIINGHRDAVDAIDDGLEQAEDLIDDAQDNDHPELLDEVSAYVDDVQGTIRHLEDRVDYETDTEETVERMNALDNAVEDLEDALEDNHQGKLVVNVSEKMFFPDEFVMEPSKILEAAGFARDEYLLYAGADADEDDPHIEKGTNVDLRDQNVFSAIPDEVGYGGTSTNTPEDDDADLPTGIQKEVEDLREDYKVDVDTEAEDSFTHVIVRDYPVPVDTYNRDTTDVMIRVPQNYPEQAPDWVYVEEEFRLKNGELPRKAQTMDTNPRNGAVVPGWVALSWHLSKMDTVTWTPYQNNLRWYLDTIVRGRLSQGD